MKIKRSQSGFTLVETLLVILVIAVIGFGGYYVWHAQNRATTEINANTSTKTQQASIKPVQPTSPYAGWKTYTLTNERLTFQYPADWTLASYPSSTDGGGNKQNIDDVELSAPGVPRGNASLTIEDGTNTGGNYNLIYSSPISVTYAGAKDYLVFAGAEHPDQGANSIGCAVLVTTLPASTTTYTPPAFPLDKNVTSVPNNNYMDIGLCNNPGTTYTTSTIGQAANTAVFKDGELIIQSMHY